jgi:hypothetical protein
MIEYNGLPDDFLIAYRSKIGNDRVYQDISANFGKVTRIEAAF